MAEYIEREAFLKDIEERYCLPCKEAGKDHNGCKCRACWVDDMCGEVIDAPAADVAPVVHGRWIQPHWKNSDYCCDCSECDGEAMHRDYQWDKNGIYPICPNCGARMDGGLDNGKMG
jgi:hypothetical protein